MLACVVFGMKAGGMDFVAAHLIERVTSLTSGMKFRCVPFTIVHGIQRLPARHRFVVASGINRIAPHLVLGLEGVISADIPVECLVYIFDAHKVNCSICDLV